ncbi:MAG: GTP cyclohydrolase I FolE2 [Ahniella sp.]|nr:GTP cyclohydrolase I FolE2 [Ahniella sp.]
MTPPDGPDSKVTSDPSAVRVLPDVAVAQAATRGRLYRVCMRGISTPILLDLPDGVQRCAASVDVLVSLDDAAARGIHMSRLYLLLERLSTEAVSPQVLGTLLGELVASQQGLSSAASITLRFDLLLRRPALVSDLSGWKAYPCRIEATSQNGVTRLVQHLELAYSSTCPMSAALARQANREAFEHQFGTHGTVAAEAVAEWLEQERGLAATPHAQRSRAELELVWQPGVTMLPFTAIVDRVEAALATPVQTAVKRVDEQAFARLNAANLMFCEDAVRRIAFVLADWPDLADFEVRVAHLESLHAHDAVAVARRSDISQS